MTDLISPGIYFGLPADRYHADPAIGSSARKALALDPVEFQYDRLRPPRPDTPALIWGQALHARVLEGRDAFERTFKIAPDMEEHRQRAHANNQEFLVTVEDLKAYAAELDIKPIPRIKADIIEAIRSRDSDVVIWEEVTRLYDADNRTGITRQVADEVSTAADWLQADPLISEVTEDGTFSGGASELSIFYEINGVRLKARLDYLLPHAICDLKSFRAWGNKSVRDAALNAIVEYRYDLQALAYIEAWREAKKMWREVGMNCVSVLDNRINESDAIRLLQKSFTGNEIEPSWIWIFVKASGSPQPIIYEWSRKRSPLSYGTAESEIEDALNNYKAMVDKFGHDQPWPPQHRPVFIEDTTWPPWFGRRG